METKYSIIRANGTRSEESVDWPEEPGFKLIASIVEPILGGRNLEHVYVWPTLEDSLDMFVDEEGHIHGLPRNEEATRLYRSATMLSHPGTIADRLPFIVGDAVLFHRRVWF